MRATKQFKIGESAVGGIIKVQIKGKLIFIDALDWNTKESVKAGSAETCHQQSKGAVDKFLNELTTSYYAEKVMEWIETKVEFPKTFGW